MGPSAGEGKRSIIEKVELKVQIIYRSNKMMVSNLKDNTNKNPLRLEKTQVIKAILNHTEESPKTTAILRLALPLCSASVIKSHPEDTEFGPCERPVGTEEAITLPADVCLNFSLFFFLHFQGLKILPRLANLLLLRMGGVWVPGTRESERIAASLSTSSACFFFPKKEMETQRGEKSVKMGASQMASVFHGYR